MGIKNEAFWLDRVFMFKSFASQKGFKAEIHSSFLCVLNIRVLYYIIVGKRQCKTTLLGTSDFMPRDKQSLSQTQQSSKKFEVILTISL